MFFSFLVAISTGIPIMYIINNNVYVVKFLIELQN